MFNHSWLELAILLIPVALILDLRAFFALSAFLLTVIPLSWWWGRRSLTGVGYERTLGQRRAFPGETIDLTMRLANEKLLPLGWLILEDRWSMTLVPEDADLFPSTAGLMGTFRSAFAIRGYERITRRYRLRCTRRGFYSFGPAQLTSGDVWGLFATDRRVPDLDWLIVYPQVLPLEALGFPPKEPFGETKATWRMLEDPSRAVGVRDHRPEDSFRHIHWKATARRQDLQVKVYEPTTTHNLVVFVNVATIIPHWAGTRPILLEKVIAVAASICNHAVDDRYLVGLMANSSIPHSDQPIKVLPSRRPDQLARMLEALAAVTSFTTVSIEGLLLEESPRLPWGATLVVVTGVVTDDLLAALMRLRDVGRRVVLVSLEDEAPPRDDARHPYGLPSGITVYRLPASDLPFDEALMGEPGEWSPEVAPPLRFGGASR
ncbi:MAG TPA: DUF58 domain-containing protein [Anaerolineae bacterium]|nr:DUF58 domain-containing protein [Anaerolineae bacterium]